MQTVLRVRYYSDTYIAADVADAKRQVSCTAGEAAAARAWAEKYQPDTEAAPEKLANLDGVDTSKDKPTQRVTYWAVEAPTCTALPPLATVAASIANTLGSLDAAELQHQRNTLADRVWLGCLCLQGKEHHAMPVDKRGQGRKKINSARGSDLTPAILNPQGFLAWLDLALPSIGKTAAYKYMDAARGLGLDAWTPEAEARALVAQRLAEWDARQQRLTLAALAAQGKEPEPAGSRTKPGVDEIKTDAIQTLFTFMDEVVNVRDAFTPVEHDTVVNRLAEILRRLTGHEWSPTA